MAEVYANAGLIAAQMAGESPILTEYAEAIAARARANALAHGDIAFAESIEVLNVPAAVRHSVRTRAVVATDPLAAPKELGHVVRNETDGPVIGYAKPLRYMFRAIEETPEDLGE